MLGAWDAMDYMRGVCTGGGEYINTPALSHIGVGEVDKKIIGYICPMVVE